MPSILENQASWTAHDWDQAGEEWSSPWGGSETIWFGSLLPRLHEHVSAGRVLEIAPGFGRMTQYLLRSCDDYIGIDLTPRCVALCRARFSRHPHARFSVNDGLTLEAVEDDSIDFAFSWDSLVHAEKNVLEAYLAELGRKLKPGGAGFIHHSNFGEYQPREGEPLVPNPHWRGLTMTAALFRRFCAQAGLRCVAQEIVSWGQEPVLNDCFSFFTRDASPSDAPVTIVERPDFFRTEVFPLRERRTLYAHRDPRIPTSIEIDWQCDAEAIVQLVSTCQRQTVAMAMVAGRRVRLLDADVGTDPSLLARAERPGTVVKTSPHAIVVQTGRGTIVLRRLEWGGAVHAAPALLELWTATRFD